MPTLKFVDAVSKTTVLSLVSLHATQKYHRDFPAEFLQHQIKFHPDQLKSA